MRVEKNRSISKNRITCSKKRAGDNRGISVIAVIVTITFVAILGMIAVYLAMANLQMKSSGLKGKDGFYMAEQPLEELKAGLQEKVGQAMSKAYLSVMEDYNSEDNASASVADSDKRKAQFKKKFLENLAASLAGNSVQVEENSKTEAEYELDDLRSKYVTVYKDPSKVIDPSKETLILTTAGGKTPLLEILWQGKDSDGVYLRNLKSVYVGPTGQAAVIETDIRLEIPTAEFPSSSTLPDLMNMIVVADGGIICEGGDTAINGSIYAGMLESQKDAAGNVVIDAKDRYSIYVKSGGSLTIGSGDKVVAEGKIYLESENTFSTASGVNLWAEGMELASGTVTLSGDTYFLDDLTVKKNETTASTVKISGSYYGYGAPETARQSYNYTKTKDSGDSFYSDRSDTDLSSAIVINGKNTTVDLSDAEEIMLAGRSYVSASEGENAAEILTGESLTVKGTQLAYLFPAELFNTETVTGITGNPVDYETYKESGLFNESGTVSEQAVKITAAHVQMDVPVETWGGKTLREIGVDETNPVTTVFYQDSSAGGQVYFYLNFTDEEKAAAFMQTFYQNTTVKTKMDEYLSFYFGENSGITVNGPDTYLRYITGGNVLTYSGSGASGSLNSASGDAGTSATLELGYQNTFYALNRKMISSVDLLEDSFSEDGGDTHDESDPDRSVFDNLVNEKGMVKFLYEQSIDGETEESGAGLTYYFKTESGAPQAVVCHNSGEGVTINVVETEDGTAASQTDVFGTVSGEEGGTYGALTIDQSMADTLRLVICTGDVNIEPGVNFRGIIMAKGKITLGAGAQLNSSPSEASQVFQSAVAGNSISPKSFFWEGDNYVLRNAAASGTTASSGETVDSYELSELVEYENWRKE